ncbi:hypothetical protein SAMN05216593_104435 [Pseudomonas asturiensis]|uniref:Cellulase (Glycosyl hydrolase family 5) n=1 Tax=Pseudomonas asturiensis TaxID=1190415 RepID=A0A1M7MQY8_9PSED|nr:hypothetical protein [Pseudomonas asturiensis]SHM93476.1 hypothetical protein SAMN05216593_104435 [Pseudomonas asturiensis]
MPKPSSPRRRRRLTVFLLGLLTSLAAWGEDPFIIGVDTQLINDEDAAPQALDLLERAGVNSVRDSAYWTHVEPRRGFLRIDPAWHAYLRSAQKHRLRPLLVLGYGNPFYENHAKPRHPAVRQAFGNYVSFVAQELTDSVDLYEIWNEWDRENPIDAWAAKDYSNLIEETVARIRRQKQPVTVLAGAVTSLGMDLGFADRLVQNGLLNQVDGLSLHPYVHCRQEQHHTPERWIAWLRWIDADLRALATRPVPLYLTEMGWPTGSGKCSVSERTQAAFLARSFFLARTLPDIKGVWWYGLMDSGVDPQDPQQNFGLLRKDLSTKPAYATLKAISKTLIEYQYDAERSQEMDSTYLLRFSRGPEQILVAWTTGVPRLTHVEASSVQRGNVHMIDSGQPEKGQFETDTPWTCNDARCSAQISIDEFPKVISLGIKPALFAQ